MSRIKYKIGIIGTGRMGKLRAEAVNKINNTCLQWICSRNKKTGEEFASNYQVKNVITDWKKACQDKNINGIIITTPNHLHKVMAVRSLKNDIHTLVEYPLANSYKNGLNILNAAGKSTAKLHLGLTHRLSSKHRAIKNEIKQLGNISSCTVIQCSGQKISRWFDQKSILKNVIIGSNYHYIDKLIDWFGKIKWVNADIYEELTEKNEQKIIDKDVGSVMVKFKNGITGYIIYARGWPPPGLGFNCKIIGEKGYIVENNGTPEKWTENSTEKIKFKSIDTILKDTKMFIDKFNKEIDVPYSPKDGLYSLKITEKASQSALNNKRVNLTT